MLSVMRSDTLTKTRAVAITQRTDGVVECTTVQHMRQGRLLLDFFCSSLRKQVKFSWGAATATALDANSTTTAADTHTI